MPFTCLLIGQDNLLIECAQYLITRNHCIKWIITATPSIQTWCEGQNIPWLSTIDALADEPSPSVDYLFSIVNGKILSKKELSIARVASINYHDAPLPKYAGVNATMWALWHDEKEHGISWHHINEGIDQGDLVYQTRFAVSANETALTLNLRCFEEAVAGFTHLINQIETNTLPASKQTSAEQSYYGINHPLPNLGFIDWQNDDACTIQRYYRALHVGNYRNNVGTLKLYLHNTYLTVTEVALAETLANPVEAGQILAIGNGCLLVSTTSQPVWLKQLKSRSGKHVSEAELTDHYGLQIQAFLPQLEPSFIEAHIATYKKALSKEKYWIAQLTQTAEHSFFTDRMAANSSDLKSSGCISLTPYFTAELPFTVNRVIAAILLYLYRINNYENFTVYSQYQQASEDALLFAQLLPLSTHAFHSGMTIQALLQCVASQLAEKNKAGTFLQDVLVRQPVLASAITDAKDYVITLGFNGQPPAANSLLHFDIDAEQQQLKLYHRIDANFQGGSALPLIQNMEHHLDKTLQAIVTNPEQAIHQFSFLSKQERTTLLTWSIGEYRPLPSNTFTSMFEQRVRFAGNKTIVFTKDEQLTYSQLWSAAEKVTSFLTRNNSEALTKISLQGFKGSELLAVVLGILKAGCIGKLVNDSTCINPVLIIHDQNVVSRQELFNEPISEMPQPDYSFAKQACLELADGMPLNQKQLINYCYWLANNCDLNAVAVIPIQENLPIDYALLLGLTGLIIGVTIDFTAELEQKELIEGASHDTS